MRINAALIMVDLQNDFCEGGALEVSGGSSVIPLANRLQSRFQLVVATQDWHPADHTSFASNHPGHGISDAIRIGHVLQILWPEHCIQESDGAEFHPGLNVCRVDKIIHKGIDSSIDSYSAFFDNEHLRSTGLDDYLREHNMQDVYILGLATDYCVKYSALDAKQLGFNVYVIADACRGVDLAEGDVTRALEEMRTAGIHVITSDAIMKPKG